MTFLITLTVLDHDTRFLSTYAKYFFVISISRSNKKYRYMLMIKLFNFKIKEKNAHICNVLHLYLEYFCILRIAIEKQKMFTSSS